MLNFNHVFSLKRILIILLFKFSFIFYSHAWDPCGEVKFSSQVNLSCQGQKHLFSTNRAYFSDVTWDVSNAAITSISNVSVTEVKKKLGLKKKSALKICKYY